MEYVQCPICGQQISSTDVKVVFDGTELRPADPGSRLDADIEYAVVMHARCVDELETLA